jgi:hypothetical protein
VGTIKTAEGGRYWSDEEEKAMWNDPEIQKKVAEMTAWRDYWVSQGRFAQGSLDLQFDFIVDVYGSRIVAGSPDVKRRVAVCLLEKSTGKRYFRPINMINPGEQGTIFETVPRENSYVDPLEVSEGTQKLVYRDGDLLRVDPQKGFVTEHIVAGPGERGTWVPVVYDQWMPQVFKEKVWTVKQPGVGKWEAYTEQNMLMAFKLGWGEGGFKTAPNGFYLEGTGVWHDYFGRYKVLEMGGQIPPKEVQEIARMVLETTKEPSVPGEASMWSREFGNAGMDIKPEKRAEMMDQFWRALYYSKTAPKDQWVNQGFTGSSYEEFKVWIMLSDKLSVTIPMPNNWGHNVKLHSLGTLDIKSSQVILVTGEEWRNNPFSKAVVDTLTQGGKFFTYTDNTMQRYGFTNSGGNLLFVGSTIRGSWIPKSNEVAQLNQAGNFNNVRPATAWWRNSVGLIEHVTESWIASGAVAGGIVDIEGLFWVGAGSTIRTEDYMTKVCKNGRCVYSNIWTPVVEDLHENEIFFQNK